MALADASAALAERLIREAQERGEFDQLEGMGKPLPDLDDPPDELWWIKKKLKREGLGVTPEALLVQGARDKLLEELPSIGSEGELRIRLAALNARIAHFNSRVTSGPMTTTMMVDADELVARWRKQRLP